MKLYSDDIADAVVYLLAKEMTQDELTTYKASLSRSVTLDLNLKKSDLKFQLLTAVVQVSNLDKGISVYRAVAMFLIWLGQTYMTSGKLKINIFDWPKLVGKVIGLVVEIVQIVKKDTTNAVLPS